MDKEKLFPPEILAKMPSVNDAMCTEPEDSLVHIKIFNPYGMGTWYLSGYDPDAEIFYGLCCLFEAECGTVFKHELVELKCPPFGLGVERDLLLLDGIEGFTIKDAMDLEKAEAR